jgi:hypothetical protein
VEPYNTRNILSIYILEMPNRRSRSNRRSNRRSRNNRKNGGGGLFERLYNPVHEALGLTENVVGAVTNTTRNVARRGIRGVNYVGRRATGRANAAVSGLLSRRRRRRN